MILPWSSWPVVTWLLLAGAAGFLAIVWRSRGRTVPGIAAFRGLAGSGALYLVTEALKFVVPDREFRLILSGITFASVGLISPYIIFLFADTTGWNGWLTRRRRRLLLAGIVAFDSLRFADPWWGLMYRKETLVQAQGIIWSQFETGPAYEGALVITVAATVFGLFAVCRAWREAGRLMRRHLLALFVACLLPVGAAVIFDCLLSAFKWFDPTPFALIGTVAITAWAMFHDRLAEVTPIARNFLVEHFNDGMVTLDVSRAVVDLNPAARTMLGLTGAGPLGRPMSDMLKPWPALTELCASDNPGQRELQPKVGGEIFWEASWNPLDEPQSRRRLGFLLVISDITARKHTEHQLHALLDERTREWRRATTAALRAAEEEQRRIGRSLHDTLCQDLVGFVRNAEMLAAGKIRNTAPAVTPVAPELSAGLANLAAQIADASRRIRDLAHLMEGPDLVHNSVNEAIEATVSNLENTLGLACELTISPNIPVLSRERGSHLIRVIREAVVNAARHGKAQHVWIDFVAGKGNTTITVSNDGISPPPPEDMAEGLGFRQMRMRVALLGGQLSLAPGHHGGAVLRLTIPAESPFPDEPGLFRP